MYAIFYEKASRLTEVVISFSVRRVLKGGCWEREGVG